jgi:hypothetical protein
MLTIIFLASFFVPFLTVGAQAEVGDLDGAVAWLKAQQASDGGFSNGFAPESDIGATADAILALAFAGEDPDLIKTNDLSPINFLEAQVQAGNVMGAGAAAKVILALNAVGISARDVGGVDLVKLVLDDFNAEMGLFGMGPFDSGLAIVALLAVDEPLPLGALNGLISTRLEDGSYSFTYDESLATGDSNTTALVVQALIAAGEDDVVDPSLDYFRVTQNEDDGWTYQKPSEFGEETDANSTAFVIQALDAAGLNLADWGDPLAALTSLQLENGAFGYNATFPDENILATIQAIPTLAGGNYVEPVAVDKNQSLSGTIILIGVSILIVLVLVGTYAGVRLKSRS